MRWINCKDRFPEPGIKVIATDGENVWTAESTWIGSGKLCLLPEYNGTEAAYWIKFPEYSMFDNKYWELRNKLT